MKIAIFSENKHLILLKMICFAFKFKKKDHRNCFLGMSLAVFNSTKTGKSI